MEAHGGPVTSRLLARIGHAFKSNIDDAPRDVLIAAARRMGRDRCITPGSVDVYVGRELQRHVSSAGGAWVEFERRIFGELDATIDSSVWDTRNGAGEVV